MIPQHASSEPSPDEGRGFGYLLRRYRHAAGLSQEALAGMAGLSADAVAALERGRRKAPRALTVTLLADALRLDDAARASLIRSVHRTGHTRPLAPTRPPAPSGELIGRDRELAQLVRALTGSSTRLVTLTGPGGVGKTSLAAAVSVSEQVVSRFPGGVCWVSLAALPPGSAVTETVATAAGVTTTGDAAPEQALVEQLAVRDVLLVLDNCEHVLEDCAKLCDSLLDAGTSLRILATSRELVRIPRESVHVVPPLALPPPDTPPERAKRSSAVRLILARAHGRGSAVPPGKVGEVVRICRRLEGIPLAIELAAARMGVLTPEQISAELDRSLTVLAGGARTAPARHRTLADAIAWSHQLLAEQEREVFAELSVFVGGWTLAAAEAVCARARPPAAGSLDVLNVIARLADKSLVQVRRDEAQARYDFLTVIREYAHRQLVESGRHEAVASAHAAHYVELAERAESRLRGPDQESWLDLLETELGNLRAAMSWALSQRSPYALRMAGALWTFCYLRGHYTEGREWLERALLECAPESAGGPIPGDVHAKALLGAGMMAFLQCEYDVARARVEAALTISQELGDRAGTALALERLGSIARERADYDRAAELHGQSLSLHVAAGDVSGTAWARHYLGFVAWLRQDFSGAQRHSTRALVSFREIGDGEGIAWSLLNLGVIAQYRGDLTQAGELLTESLSLSRRLGYREGVAWSLNQLGVVERRRGRFEQAVRLLEDSLAVHRSLRDRWRATSVVEELAAVAVRRGRADEAAYLLAAAAAERDAIEAPVPMCERPDHEHTLQAVRDDLDADTFAAAWAAARSASLDVVAGRLRGLAEGPSWAGVQGGRPG